MPIENSTVYSKQLLLAVARYVSPFKQILWIVIGVCAVGSLAGSIYLAAMGALTDNLLFSSILVWVLAAFEFLSYWVLPLLNVKNAKNMNSTIRYVFEEESFCITADASLGGESATYRYGVLQRVEKKKSTLYLFFASRQAFLVDLTQMPADQQLLLRQAMENALTPKKVKWKI